MRSKCQLNNLFDVFPQSAHYKGAVGTPPLTKMKHCTKVKFSIKDFFSKCDQIRSFQRIWSHLLRKSLMENSIFCAVTPFFLSTFRALYVGIFYFCISRPSNFSSLKCSYYIMLWSVKCTFTCQGWYF